MTDRRARGPRVPARVQIMGWFVLVMTGALATVVLLVVESEHAAVEERVNRALEQDVREFAGFAGTGGDPVQGVVERDPGVLFERHLSSQYPGRSEVLIGVTETGGRLGTIKQADDSVRGITIDEPLLRGIVDDPATLGTAATSGGDMRWLSIDVLPPQDAPAEVADSRYWFVAGYFVHEAHAELDSTVRNLIGVSAIALVLAAAMSWFVSGQILAPVRDVRRAAAELTEHDLTNRIPVHGRDDLAALAAQFNAMLDRLESAFATRRQFLDDAGHELRTPITIIRGHLEVMGDDPAERAEVVRLCTDELDRMARIVDDLLLLAKAEQQDFLRPDWVSVPELTSDIEAKARAIGARHWVLEQVGEGEAWLDGQRVTQAVLQLAQNAVQHTAPGAQIRIGSSLHEGAVSFWVTDQGPGLAAQDVSRIFERFVRGDPATRESTERGGAGLGLAIVAAIAEAHHGATRVISEPGRGATFGIELPAVPDHQTGERSAG